MQLQQRFSVGTAAVSRDAVAAHRAEAASASATTGAVAAHRVEAASAGLTLVVGVCIRWPTGVPGRIGSFCGSGCESSIGCSRGARRAAASRPARPVAAAAQRPRAVPQSSRPRQPLCAQRGQLRRRCRLPAGSACLCALVALQPAGDLHASSLKCRRRTPGSARFPPPHRAHEFPSCRMDPDGLSAPRRTGCRAAAGRQRQPALARRAQRSSKKGSF